MTDNRTDRDRWQEMHALWMEGAISTDTLLTVALMLGPGAPMAWLWAMTVIEIRMTKPSRMVVIAGV